MKHPVKGLSPTHIKTFLTCPYQYYAKYVTKEVKFEQNDHARFGSAVHENIELYLLGQRELSPRLEKLRPVLDKMKRCLVGAETKLAVTKWNTKCDFFYNDSYLRCIVDAIVASPDGKHVIAIDWKTGKKRDDQVQHDVIKRCLRAAYPEAETITTVFSYFFHDDIDIQVFRPNIPLHDLDDKVDKVINAHKTGEFPYNPNGLCKKWCDVVSCPHNGRNA